MQFYYKYMINMYVTQLQITNGGNGIHDSQDVIIIDNTEENHERIHINNISQVDRRKINNNWHIDANEFNILKYLDTYYKFYKTNTDLQSKERHQHVWFLEYTNEYMLQNANVTRKYLEISNRNNTDT